jgi:hypothetical protein
MGGKTAVIDTEANMSSVNNKCPLVKKESEKDILLPVYLNLCCRASRQAKFEQAFVKTLVLHNHTACFRVCCLDDFYV